MDLLLDTQASEQNKLKVTSINTLTATVCAEYFAHTWSISWRIVEEAEAKHQEDDCSPGDFAQQLEAVNSSPLHGPESQDHRRPNDEDKPGGHGRIIKTQLCACKTTHIYVC